LLTDWDDFGYLLLVEAVEAAPLVQGALKVLRLDSIQNLRILDARSAEDGAIFAIRTV